LKYIENSFSTDGARKLFGWQLYDKAIALFHLALFVRGIVDYKEKRR
jgi:hypothetical protein